MLMNELISRTEIKVYMCNALQRSKFFFCMDSKGKQLGIRILPYEIFEERLCILHLSEQRAAEF